MSEEETIACLEAQLKQLEREIRRRAIEAKPPGVCPVCRLREGYGYSFLCAWCGRSYANLKDTSLEAAIRWASKRSAKYAVASCRTKTPPDAPDARVEKEGDR